MKRCLITAARALKVSGGRHPGSQVLHVSTPAQTHTAGLNSTRGVHYARDPSRGRPRATHTYRVFWLLPTVAPGGGMSMILHAHALPVDFSTASLTTEKAAQYSGRGSKRQAQVWIAAWQEEWSQSDASSTSPVICDAL